MAMVFSPTNMSYCNLTRVNVTPPVREEFVDKHGQIQKYINRSSAAENDTFLQYARTHTLSQPKPQLSTNNNAVGVKYKFVLSTSFLFQYVIMNTKFRSLDELKHRLHDRFPKALLPMAYMMENHAQFIQSNDQIRNFLKILSYKDVLIDQFINFKDGLLFLYYKICNDQTFLLPAVQVTNLPSNLEQQTVIEHVKRKIVLRSDDYWADYRAPVEQEEHVAQIEPYAVQINPIISPDDHTECKYTRPLLITGDPGCGKSYVLKKIIRNCLEEGLMVIIAHPTAKQARTFLQDVNNGQETSGEVKSDTVHSIFRVSTDSDDKKINWSLIKYDVLIVDEIAKVDVSVVDHIFDHLKVLPVSPFLIMAGDPYQQRPIGSTISIFESLHYKSQVDTIRLYHQSRCTCELLKSHLQMLRVSYPSEHTLQFFNSLAWSNNGTISSRDSIATGIVWKAFQTNPETLFLTITKDAAAWINTIIVQHLFASEKPLRTSVVIGDQTSIDVYVGMKMMIVENQCKELNIVNGAVVTLQDVKHGNLIVLFSDSSLGFVSPSLDDNLTYYPVVPYYAGTIYKAQGETVAHATIWLDITIKSPGTAYTAFSRVRCHQNLRLLEKVVRRQLCPVSTD